MLKTKRIFVILGTMSNPDLIVIGSGLAGLIVAVSAHQNGQTVRVLESREVLGNHLRSMEVRGHNLVPGLQFLPNSPSTSAALGRLSDLLQIPLLTNLKSARALTYENGGFRDFVGFGDDDLKSIEELSRFNVSSWVECSEKPEVWVDRLISLLPEDAIGVRSEVTRFEVGDGRIRAVEINGAKTMTGSRYVYSGPISGLERLFAEDALASKTRSSLAKSKGLTAITLSFAHGQTVSQEPGLHFLAGSGQEYEPFVGRFFDFADGVQRSTWVAFVTDDRTDEESVAHVIRSMKRQMKRAYPTAFENLLAEKLVVGFDSHGHAVLKLKAAGLLPDFSNMFLAVPRVSPEPGLMAALERGWAATDWLFPPESTLNSNSSSSDVGPAPADLL